MFSILSLYTPSIILGQLIMSVVYILFTIAIVTGIMLIPGSIINAIEIKYNIEPKKPGIAKTDFTMEKEFREKPLVKGILRLFDKGEDGEDISSVSFEKALRIYALILAGANLILLIYTRYLSEKTELYPLAMLIYGSFAILFTGAAFILKIVSLKKDRANNRCQVMLTNIFEFLKTKFRDIDDCKDAMRMVCILLDRAVPPSVGDELVKIAAENKDNPVDNGQILLATLFYNFEKQKKIDKDIPDLTRAGERLYTQLSQYVFGPNGYKEER